MLEPPVLLPLTAIADVVRVGEDDRRIRRARERGESVRLRRGAYVDPATWDTAFPRDRYLADVAAVVATRRTRVVVSHASAACIWGLPLISWPRQVHLTEPPNSHRRSKNRVTIHRRELSSDEVQTIGDFRVTSLLRTLVDLAGESPFRDAVCALDAALDRRSPSTTKADLFAVAGQGGLGAPRRAARAIEFASDLAMTPLESLSRVTIAELGFPAPIEQVEFEMSGGRRILDFFWPDSRVAGEADGHLKYVGPDAGEAIWDEKLRQFEFLDHGVQFTRWGWADCRDPRRLAVRLQAAGLRRAGAPLRAM